MPVSCCSLQFLFHILLLYLQHKQQSESFAHLRLKLKSYSCQLNESYRSQLGEEAERDGDHQAQNKRDTYMAEGGDQQRAPLEKSPSVEESLPGEVGTGRVCKGGHLNVTDLCRSKTRRLGTAAVVPKSAIRDNAVSLTAWTRRAKYWTLTFQRKCFILSCLNLFSCCFRQANGTSSGVKDLDASFWLLTPDRQHIHEGQASWGAWETDKRRDMGHIKWVFWLWCRDFSVGEDLPDSGIGNMDLKKVRTDALLTPSWWMKIWGRA